MRIKIRGIYSTSLSKFFLDRGYKVVLPSEKQKRRLNLKKGGYPIDASLVDYKYGIKISGPSSEVVLKEITENFDSIWFEDFVGRIYKGKVVGSFMDGSYVVKIGRHLGILRESPVSEKPLVQIKKEENGMFFLTQDIRIFGKYVVLIKNGRTSFHKEFPEELRKDLEDIELDGFGIFFTQFSIGRERDEIEKDLEECLRLYKKINGDFSFKRSWIVKFTKEGREKLDKIRKLVLPTSRKHHLIRMFGLDGKLDVIEELNPERIDIIERECGGEIELIHDRIIGGEIIRKEKIIEKKEGFLRTYREIKSPGFYDGLKIRKIPGDYAISEIREGEIFYEIKYYRKDGRLIGKYVNFNTPIEMFGDKVYYIDLLIDLVKVNDSWILKDVEEFEEIKEEVPSIKRYKKMIFEKAKEICGGEGYEIEGS